MAQAPVQVLVKEKKIALLQRGVVMGKNL